MVVFLFIWVLKEYKKVIIHILNNFSQFLAGFSYQIQNRSQILVYLDYLYMTLCTICSNWRFLLLFPIHQTGLCQLFIESQSNFFSLVIQIVSRKDRNVFCQKSLQRTRWLSLSWQVSAVDTALQDVRTFTVNKASITKVNFFLVFLVSPLCQPTLWSRKLS